MKILKRITVTIFFLLVTIANYAQMTPEQKKQQEEMQKKAAEAQKKAMEMMKNNPQFKETMKMIETAEQQQKQERMMKQLEKEKRQKDQTSKHLKEFYWRNKIASNTNGKFADWKWGDVQIAYYNGKGKRDKDFNLLVEDYIVIGRINNEGLVTLDLPQAIKTNRVISNGLFPEMHEIVNDNVTFSNPDAPFQWYGYVLYVLQGDKSIGSLYIGNSERATHNLASPSHMKYGDEGYLLYWAYSKEACKATYSKDDQNTRILEGELEKTVDQYTRCELNFKPGWNLIKIEVNGNHTIGNRTRWKFKIYSSIKDMPSDGKYYFKYKN